MNLAQIVQSHALSFFHLSSPDLLFGMDADPAKRNIFGVAMKADTVWINCYNVFDAALPFGGWKWRIFRRIVVVRRES